MLKAVSSLAVLLLLIIAGLTGTSVYLVSRKFAEENVTTTTTTLTTSTTLLVTTISGTTTVPGTTTSTIQTTISDQTTSYTTTSTLLTTTYTPTEITENCCSYAPNSANGYDSSCQVDVNLNPGDNIVCWGSEWDDYGINRDYYSGWFKCPDGYYVGNIYATIYLADSNDCIYSYRKNNEERARICGLTSFRSNFNNTQWVKFRFKSDPKGVAEGVMIESIECVPSEENISTTTTTTSTTSTTTTIVPKLVECSTCPPPSECSISCGETISGLYTTDKHFFKFSLDSPDFVNIRLNGVNYDLYTRWETESCPDVGDPGIDWDCRTYTLIGEGDTCGQNLEAGTYYIMIDYFTDHGTYDLSLSCESVTTSTTTSETTTTSTTTTTVYCLTYGEACSPPSRPDDINPCCSGLICQISGDYGHCVYLDFTSTTTSTSTTSTTSTSTTSTTTTAPPCPYECACDCVPFAVAGMIIYRPMCPEGYKSVQGYSCPDDCPHYCSDQKELCCIKTKPEIFMQLSPTKSLYDQGDILDITLTATDEVGINYIELDVEHFSMETLETDVEYTEHHDCEGATECSKTWSITLDKTDYWQFQGRVKDTDGNLAITETVAVTVKPAATTTTSTSTTTTLETTTSTTTSTTTTILETSTTTTVETTTTITWPGGPLVPEPLDILDALIQLLRRIFGWYS